MFQRPSTFIQKWIQKTKEHHSFSYENAVAPLRRSLRIRQKAKIVGLWESDNEAMSAMILDHDPWKPSHR
jgi:hypothetical protein